MIVEQIKETINEYGRVTKVGTQYVVTRQKAEKLISDGVVKALEEVSIGEFLGTIKSKKKTNK